MECGGHLVGGVGWGWGEVGGASGWVGVNDVSLSRYRVPTHPEKKLFVTLTNATAR